MAESSYLRYPHVACDLITFAAEDDVWLAVRLALQALEQRPPRRSTHRLTR